MPLDVLYLYLDGCRRLEAGRRLEYISDTTTAVASMFSKKSNLKEIIGQLESIAEGEEDG